MFRIGLQHLPKGVQHNGRSHRTTRTMMPRQTPTNETCFWGYRPMNRTVVNLSAATLMISRSKNGSRPMLSWTLACQPFEQNALIAQMSDPKCANAFSPIVLFGLPEWDVYPRPSKRHAQARFCLANPAQEGWVQNGSNCLTSALVGQI
jgi:hypothetical protein